MRRPSQIEDLHAVTGAVDDAPVELLGLAQGFFARLAFGDVGVRPGQADWRPGLVSRHGPARQEPPDAAVAVNHAVFDFVRGSLAPDVGLSPFEYADRVVGVHQPAQVVEMIADLMILVAEQPLEDGIHVDVAGCEVPVPHADPARRCSTPVAIVSARGVHGDTPLSKRRRQSQPPARRRRRAWSPVASRWRCPEPADRRRL